MSSFCEVLQMLKKNDSRLNVENASVAWAGDVHAVGGVQPGKSGHAGRNVKHGKRGGTRVVHVLEEQTEGTVRKNKQLKLNAYTRII